MVKKIKSTSGVEIPFPTPASVIEILDKIVVDSKLATEDISNMYVDSYKALEAKGVVQNIEILAVNGVKNMVRKLTRKAEFIPKAKAVPVVGLIVGDGGCWDKIENMRSAAKRYADKNGIEAAIEANLINGDNLVLDQRKQIFGKENPKYLEPLDEKVRDRSRTLHLIAKLNGSNKYKYGTLQTNDPMLAVGWGKVKLFTPCTTFAIVKEELDDEFKLNSSQAEETTTIFKAIKDSDIDVDKVMLETLTPQLTKISEVEKHHEAYKDAWDRRIFVKGIVAWINRDRPSPWGSVWMGLMGDDVSDTGEVRVNIPEHIQADFGENSVVIVIGKTKRNKSKDQETYKYIDADVGIEAVGIYCLKGLRTPVDLNRPEASANEDMIEGWLDV